MLNAAYDIKPAWQDSALEEGALCVGRGRGRGDEAAVLRQVHGALFVVVHACALRGRAGDRVRAVRASTRVLTPPRRYACR